MAAASRTVRVTVPSTAALPDVLAAVARAHNLPMTPHFVMELSASLLATVPNISYAEMTDGGRWKDLRIIAEAGEEVDGYYVPSERPGHGIILDRDYLATHKI